MWLLLVYIALTLAGSGAIYFIGLFIESTWPVASLPAFLVLFFLMLWVSWIVAVRITAPKVEPAA
jgi:hypothetical protein